MQASSRPLLFKRPILKDKDDNIMDEKESVHDDNVKTLLSSLNFSNKDDDDYLLTTVIEDLNVPLPAPLKLKHPSDLTIAGHCDGIICLKLFIGNIILCNPAMKEFKLLPKSFLLLPEDDINRWSLNYELSYYDEYLGFGYDPKCKDYKIVRFVIYEESCYWFKAEVYTMNSNSWREIKTDYNEMTSFVSKSSDLPIYLKGNCYWHVCGYHISWGDFILSFDMGNELFREISISDLPDGCRLETLTVWKEFITILTYQEEIVVSHSFDMWVLMYDGDGKGSWIKHLTIRPVEGDTCPLLFWKGDQLLLINNNDAHIVLYNIGTQMLKYLPIQCMGNIINIQAVGYVNSIVSINGGNLLEDTCISAFYGSGKFCSSYREDDDNNSAFDGNDKSEQ
ncbi:PREDICTED: putative F-box protein At4g10190-like [Fragaria vesca subsp. vesca]